MKETKPRNGDFGEHKWRQRGGEYIAIKHMDNKHLVNTMRGIVRAMAAPCVAWHYWYYELSREMPYLHRANFIYQEGLREIVHRTSEAIGELTRKRYEWLTAMRMECDYRDITWWDHDKLCDCAPCMNLKQEGARYYEQDPNYIPMK